MPERLPGRYYDFEYEGYQIYETGRGRHTVYGTCRQCDESAQAQNVGRGQSWEEVKRLTSLCAGCKWLESEYEGELAKITDEIEDLETKHENLLTAITALPGVKRPKSLSWDDLEDAGLILHRQDQESVLGFILIDYSREEMHRLVKAVDGRLEPFSRGFKLFLGDQYYKLFPGSYWWEVERYTYHSHETYLDFLHKEQRGIEARADEIRSRIEAHAVA